MPKLTDKDIAEIEARLEAAKKSGTGTGETEA